VFLTDLKIAARNLVQHTKRSLFLGTAIAVVAGVLVLLNGLTAGIRTAMLESGTTLQTGHVNVGGFFKPTSGSSAPMVTNWEKVLADTRRIVPEVDYVAVRMRGYAKTVSENASMDLVLSGIDVEKEPRLKSVVQLKAGSLDALAAPGTILLFEDQAKRLEVTVGDALTLSAPTERGASNTADVKVVAIARNVGILSSFCAFTPSVTLRQLYNLKASTTGAIQLYLKDERTSVPVAERLREGLKQAKYRVMDPDPQPYWMKLFVKVNAEDWTGQKLDVTTWEDELSFLTWILTALSGLRTILMVVLVVIVIVGIYNTLAIAIRERTREIGTMRAIGMQRRKVLLLFMLEMLCLGLAGSIGGALAAAGLAAVVNAAHLPVPEAFLMILMQDRWRLLVTPGTVVGSAVFVTVVTVLAAISPSWKASRLKPVTAMHHIG
jgi:ABC-type lipoprotein release transport system permease subunit